VSLSAADWIFQNENEKAQAIGEWEVRHWQDAVSVVMGKCFRCNAVAESTPISISITRSTIVDDIYFAASGSMLFRVDRKEHTHTHTHTRRRGYRLTCSYWYS